MTILNQFAQVFDSPMWQGVVAMSVSVMLDTG